MASADYRVRIADAGASTVSGNVALTLTLADLAAVPIVSGPKPNLLKGGSQSFPFPLECLVDTVLFLNGTRLEVIGRLIEVQQNLDAAGWATIATGRIKYASEVDGRGKITFGITDEIEVSRNTEIFRSNTSLQFHPPGLAEDFRGRTAAGTTTYVVKEIAGTDYARLQPFDDEDGNVITQIPAAFMDVLRSDLLPSEERASGANSAGNFTSLRFRYNSADHTVVTFSYTRGILAGSIESNGPLGTLAAEGRLSDVWVYIASHGLSVTDQITGRFYWPTGVLPTKDAPLLVGGVDGIHPATFARDVLDGTYGGEAVRYPSAVFDGLEALNLLPVWARIEKTWDREAWLARNWYQPFGMIAAVGTDLSLRPTPLRILPLDVDPDTLEVLSAADSDGLTWEHVSDLLVNVVVMRSKDLRPIDPVSDRGSSWPVDEYEMIDAPPLRYEHDTVSTLGTRVHTIESDLIFQANSVSDLATELFDILGDGAQLGSIRVPDNAAVEVGDLALIDHDTLKGFNADTGDRTGKRLVMLTAFREKGPASTIFDYLDFGADNQPLDPPTISVVQDGTDADLVNVTISGLNAGESATVFAAAGSSLPALYDHVRAGVGNETVSFRLAAASGTAYVAAYTTASDRIRSSLATDTVALSPRALITSATLVKTTRAAQIRWTVSGALGMRLNVSIHARGTDPSFGSNIDVDATDLFYDIADVPPGDVVSVQLTPYTGWTGSAVSGSAGDAIVEQAAFVTKGGFLIVDDDLVRGRGVYHNDTSSRTVTGSTSPTDLETVEIPGRTIGLRGALKLTAVFKPSGTNAAKTAWIAFDGTILASVSWLAAETDRVEIECIVSNDDDHAVQYTSSRIVSALATPAKPAPVAMTKDTTADLDITFVGDLTSGSDTMELELSRVEHIGEWAA